MASWSVPCSVQPFRKLIRLLLAWAWSPLNEARLVRHAGEPTEKDLLLGLMFYTEWFPEEAALANRDPMAPADVELRDRVCWKPVAGRDLVWAVQGACELLLKLDAGSWQANGQFRPRSSYSDSYRIERYWSSRNEMISRLGSERLLYPPTLPIGLNGA